MQRKTLCQMEFGTPETHSGEVQSVYSVINLTLIHMYVLQTQRITSTVTWIMGNDLT